MAPFALAELVRIGSKGQGRGGDVWRIGELSRRVGVSDHLLRAWESRYGLLQPVRSAGGFRLYTVDDEHRVRRMQAYLAEGMSAAEAARIAVADDAPGTRGPRTTDASVHPSSRSASDGRASIVTAEIAQALARWDETAAHAALDRLFATFTIETVLDEILLPYLHQLGERWQTGEVTVAQEHFASNVIRARCEAISRGWGAGHGPLAVLACPPGELHDLALLMFGIVLHRNGWRIVYLGADTPVGDMQKAVDELHPGAVVLAATDRARFTAILRQLQTLHAPADDKASSGQQPPVLALAGAGGSASLARRAGARWLAGSPVAEAQRLAQTIRPLAPAAQ
jgi:DNA-binding transcriptional MerR regulator